MKYKLLLAEDEQIERLAMKKIIGMEYQDVYDIYEAENGIEAVDISLKVSPDIIFMDIKMPGMTGLEAAAKIRQTDKDVKIIFVTAYDTFEYAKAAISVKAEELLLKPVDMEEFLIQMKEWTQQLEQERAFKNTSDDKGSIKRQYEIEFIEMVQKFSCQKEDIEYYLNVLNIDFSGEVAAQVDFTTSSDYKMAGNVKKDIITKEFIERLLINIGNDTDRGYNIRIVTGRAESSIKIIFFVEYDKSDMDINLAKSTLQQNVRSILDKTSQYMGLRVDIRISDYFESQLKLPTAIYQTGKHGNAQTDNLVSYPFELEKELTDILGQGIFDNTDVLITKISSELSKNFSDNGYKHMVTELYTVVKRAIIQISPDALMSYADKLCDEVDDEQSFCHFFNELLEYSRNYTSQHSDRNKMLIQKVKAYVEEHYAEEITLDDMADMIGYSTYYFMKLIKEYLGMSFGDFLTSVRMNNAKKLLLSTNMSISEVGYSVGYNDANYFARVFKRQEKITPSEYKKQLQNTSK